MVNDGLSGNWIMDYHETLPASWFNSWFWPRYNRASLWFHSIYEKRAFKDGYPPFHIMGSRFNNWKQIRTNHKSLSLMQPIIKKIKKYGTHETACRKSLTKPWRMTGNWQMRIFSSELRTAIRDYSNSSSNLDCFGMKSKVMYYLVSVFHN